MDDLKQRAIELRRKGLTYQEISSALDGAVSVDWCKRNLKGIQKEKVSDACVLELIEKATRPEGMTVYEANAVMFKHNKEKALSRDQMKNIRKKASYADANMLVQTSMGRRNKTN